MDATPNYYQSQNVDLLKAVQLLNNILKSLEELINKFSLFGEQVNFYMYKSKIIRIADELCED